MEWRKGIEKEGKRKEGIWVGMEKGKGLRVRKNDLGMDKKLDGGSFERKMIELKGEKDNVMRVNSRGRESWSKKNMKELKKNDVEDDEMIE